MEKAKVGNTARTLLVVSMLLFVGAAISATFLDSGLYLALGLILIGGFAMLISSRIREDSIAKKKFNRETLEVESLAD